LENRKTEKHDTEILLSEISWEDLSDEQLEERISKETAGKSGNSYC